MDDLSNRDSKPAYLCEKWTWSLHCTHYCLESEKLCSSGGLWNLKPLQNCAYLRQAQIIHRNILSRILRTFEKVEFFIELGYYTPTVSDTFRFHWENVYAQCCCWWKAPSITENRDDFVCAVRGELLWWRLGLRFVIIVCKLQAGGSRESRSSWLEMLCESCLTAIRSWRLFNFAVFVTIVSNEFNDTLKSG